MNSRPIGPFTLNANSWQAKGLVFWIPFMEVIPLERFSKTQASITGTPGLSYDVARASWNFSGTGQYTSLPFAPVTAVPLTICARIKPSNVSFTRSIVSICASANTTNFFHLRIFLTGPAISFSTGDGSTSSASTSTAPVTGVWQHACGVTSAVNSRAVYLDGGGKGTQSTSRTPSGLDQTNPGALGGSSFSIPFPGQLADVRIYNRALNDAEVLALTLPQCTWDLFAPVNRYFPFPVGGNVTLTGSATAAATTAFTGSGLAVVSGTGSLATTTAAGDTSLAINNVTGALPVTTAATDTSNVINMVTGSLPATTAVTESGLGSAIGSASLPTTTAAGDTSLVDSNVSGSLPATAALTDTSNAINHVTGTLPVTMADVENGGLLVGGTTSMAATPGLSDGGLLDAGGGVGLNTVAEAGEASNAINNVTNSLVSGQAIDETAILNALNALTLAAAPETTANGGLLVIGSQTLNLVSALLANGSLTLDMTLALTQLLGFVEQSYAEQGVSLVANATPLLGVSAGLEYVLNALLSTTVDLTTDTAPSTDASLSMQTSVTANFLTVLQAVAAHQLTVSDGLTASMALERLGSTQLHFNLSVTESGKGTFSTSFGLFAAVVHAVSGGKLIETTVGLSILNALAANGLLGFDGHILLSQAVTLQLLYDLRRYGSVAMNAMQMLLVNGVFSAIRHLLLTTSAKLNVARFLINFLIETPDGRKFYVALDSRLMDVAEDNRTLVVDSEKRLVYVPAEDRSYLVIRR